MALLGLELLFLLNDTNKVEFGKPLGSHMNVIAYSSDGKECIDPSKMESYYYNGIYTGLKWQCVEYARRYLIINHNITFDSVDFAYQIFDLNHFISLKRQNDVNPIINIMKVLNRSIITKNTIPMKGDLLIWDKRVTMNNTGHVAVITKITKNHIYIAEQNWDNISWSGQYSRKLPIIYKNNILDIDSPNIMGWIKFEKDTL